MALKIRLEYVGAAYHVMARGNQGPDIYDDERDRKLWLETLGEACEKTGWRIHAWVMMNNHYHLLLETPEANLVAGMKWLQGTLLLNKPSTRGTLTPLGSRQLMRLYYFADPQRDDGNNLGAWHGKCAFNNLGQSII